MSIVCSCNLAAGLQDGPQRSIAVLLERDLIMQRKNLVPQPRYSGECGAQLTGTTVNTS